MSFVNYIMRIYCRKEPQASPRYMYRTNPQLRAASDHPHVFRAAEIYVCSAAITQMRGQAAPPHVFVECGRHVIAYQQRDLGHINP